jgi:hypothetical protein
MKRNIWSWSQITEDEYRANLNGMNTFFGAVLGFVLTDVQTATLVDFAQLLIFTAALVIGILYVSASSQRWLYAALNLLLIWALPGVLPEGAGNAGRLQVTLAVWTFMTIGVEAWWSWQRRRNDTRIEAAP